MTCYLPRDENTKLFRIFASMNQQGARAFLIGFTLLALLTLFQQIFHPIKLAGLQGAFDKGEAPEFSTAEWFKGQYQVKADHYLKYNTAFNGELVRLRNQVDYSVFGNINTILTLGKENYIFDPNYIYALNGTDIPDDSTLTEKVHAVNHSIALLDSLHVPLFVFFAPNKASYYQEYLPEPLTASSKTNRAFFNSILEEHKVPVIEFSEWFLTMKSTTKYPLVPKYGAHWTTYGAYLAVDSMLEKMYSGRNEKFASFALDKIEMSDKALYTDDDYLASLNLMVKWKSPRMAYPKLSFSEGKKPTVLIISDSFIWNLYDLGIIQNCFSEKSQLRYYNKTSYDYLKNNQGPVFNLSIENLKMCDFVVVISSDPSLKDFGFGFFESLNHLTNHE